jgi:hypothetical protein
VTVTRYETGGQGEPAITERENGPYVLWSDYSTLAAAFVRYAFHAPECDYGVHCTCGYGDFMTQFWSTDNAGWKPAAAERE